MISQEAEHCRSCARKAFRKTVEVHCDLCRSKFLPKSWRQVAGARIVFCPSCRADPAKATQVRAIAWEARKRKGVKANIAGTSDRRLLRLIAEAQGSVRVLFDREKHIGKIPANLLREYSALAVDGSIPSTPPPRRSHHAAPRALKRTRAHPKVLSISQFIEKRGQVQHAS
jgi:uncharacterized Zn finger protein (UPF0148 family)